MQLVTNWLEIVVKRPFRPVANLMHHPLVGVFHFSIQLLLSEFRVRAEGIFRVIEHENLTLCRTSRLNRHCFHVFVDSYTLVHSRLEPLIYICLMHMEMQHTFFFGRSLFNLYISCSVRTCTRTELRRASELMTKQPVLKVHQYKQGVSYSNTI